MTLTNNIVINSGADFIETHLTNQLITERRKITILDNLSVGKIKNLKQILVSSNQSGGQGYVY